MGFIASLLVVYGVAGAALGGAVVIAIASYLHHRQHSRVAEYVQRPSAAIREGFALLRGTVVAGDDPEAARDPVISIEIPTPRSAVPARAVAHAFPLQLPSGAVVRVEPEEDALVLDTTFALTTRGYDPVYRAEIRRGEDIYLAGVVRREIDARASGKGYRDAARAWVVRAPARGKLCISSDAVIARHAERASFHGAWAVALGAGFAGLQVGVFGSFHACALGVLEGEAEIGWSVGFFALLATGVAIFAYRRVAEVTAPWVEREIGRG